MKTVSLLLLLLSWTALSIEGGGVDHCKKLLEPSRTLIPSRPIDPEFFKEIERLGDEIYEVAKSLGYSIPDHQSVFMSPADLSQWVAQGPPHYPAPHWFDGLILSKGGPPGVLEVVMHGCPTCRAFFDDTLDLTTTGSIIAHVFGHYHVGEVSYYQTRLKDNPISASAQLAHKMTQWYKAYDRNEVSLFYQTLVSLRRVQDIPGGTFEHPSEFTPKKIEPLKKFLAEDSLDVGENTRHPKAPTPSVIQAFVSNLPPDAAPWKREMAALVEEISRNQLGISQNKIFNEGWATFSQYFLIKYTSLANPSDTVKMASLLFGVAPPFRDAKPRFDNPYWLGLEGWFNIYKKFLADKGLNIGHTNKDVDREFLAQVANPIIKNVKDREFLFKHFDDNWIFNQNVNLIRPSSLREVTEKGGIAIQELQAGKKYYTVVSRTNAERIMSHVYRQNADHRLSQPVFSWLTTSTITINPSSTATKWWKTCL